VSVWSFEVLDLPLKMDWKISHGSAKSKPVGIVRIKSEGFEGLGEVAESTGSGLMRSYKKQFENLRFPTDLESVAPRIANLQVANPLKVGIETALLRWHSAKLGSCFYQSLGCEPPGLVQTSHSVPILWAKEVEAYIEKFDLQRFSSLKVKVSGGSRDVEMLKEVARCFSGTLRIDANESFKTAKHVLQFLNEIKDLPVEFLEQPLPQGAVDESVELKSKSLVTIVGDESLQGGEVSETHAKQFHGVNVKVMKAGGLANAHRQIQQAKALGLKVMLGCMVETSLGISTAFALGGGVDWYDLDGFLLFEKDPHGLIAEHEGVLTLINNSLFR